MLMDNVIDFVYMKYRRLWNENRFEFSGNLTRLKIANNQSKLTKEQQHELDCMNKVLAENNGDWFSK